METIETLREHIKGRALEIAKLKASGKKIIGYAPGGFVPDELIYAADAIPLCLNNGGDAEPTAEALALTPRFICTFCRSQIGYWKLGEVLPYQLPDIMVVPIVDANNKLIADSFAYYAGYESFRWGVPHDKTPNDVAYFKLGLERFRAKLEEVTGNKITDERLAQEIEYCNERRSLLKEISYMRVGADPVISSADYTFLHYAAALADKDFYIQALRDICADLKVKRESAKQTGKVRLMLIASTYAYGDNRINDGLADLDADIVYEEVAEGLLPYLNNVELAGDLMQNLTDAYFTKRIKGPWDRPWNGRFEMLMEKAKEFDVKGVIWYQTLYRDGADLQAWSARKRFKAEGIHFEKLETDYTVAEKGPMKTRIETLVELVKQDEQA